MLLVAGSMLLPQTWAGTAAGPHPVGVTRLDADGHLLALVWRPVRDAASRLTLADLARLACGEAAGDTAGTVPACLPEELAPVAGQPLSASSGGTAAPGRRPLVVLLGGLSARGLGLSSLAETLASHGYVAAVMAAPPSEVPRGFDDANVREARAAFGRVVDRLRDDPGVDAGRLVVAAWSFGGVPAVLEALARPEVRAVISLDSAMRYQYGADLIRAAGADPTAYRGDVLSLSAGVDNTVEKDEGVLEAMTRASVTRVVATGMPHAEFTDVGGAMHAMTLPAADRLAFHERYARVVASIVTWLRERVPTLP